MPICVAASAAHRNIHVLVIRIGDFSTENTFLDPMAKSILQFLRVLLTDGYVTKFEVRSIGELAEYWRLNHRIISHVVLVGHGQTDGLLFGAMNLISADALSAALNVAGVTPKTFISLACETGKGVFAREFSGSPVCKAYIGPYCSIHGADASLFVQNFLSTHFLDGLTLLVAMKKSYGSISRCKFRLWSDGALRAGFHVKK